MTTRNTHRTSSLLGRQGVTLRGKLDLDGLSEGARLRRRHVRPFEQFKRRGLHRAQFLSRYLPAASADFSGFETFVQ